MFELFGRRLGARQILLEECVVEFDHVFDEVFVFGAFGLGEVGGDVDEFRVAGVVHECTMGEQVGDPVEARLLAEGEFGGVGVGAEHLANLREGAVERRPFPVELVDEHEPRNAELGGVAPQHDIL